MGIEGTLTAAVKAGEASESVYTLTLIDTTGDKVNVRDDGRTFTIEALTFGVAEHAKRSLLERFDAKLFVRRNHIIVIANGLKPVYGSAESEDSNG